MTNKEEQIRLHHEKWKKWKLSIQEQEQEKQKQKQQVISKGKQEQSTQNYAAKIINKLQQPHKQRPQLSVNFEREFQGNSCSVCFEIMIPPYRPMTLFPCGHNMCKICLIGEGAVDGRYDKKNFKILRCALCNQQIENCALNRNLMNLICTYTDNKHLIDKEKDQREIEEHDTHDTLDRLKLRCDILEKQRKSIAMKLAKETKNKQVLTQVLDKLNSQKARNMRETASLEEEIKLIECFLKDKKEELQKIKAKIASTQEKKKVVEKTLEPLRTQKQKLQVLQAAKLIE